MYTKPFYIVVNPTGSKFARTLQKALNERVTNRVYRSRNLRVGYHGFPITARGMDKVRQFQAFANAHVSCPKFTTRRESIGELGSKTVFARTLTNSTNGKGIVEIDVENTQRVVEAPLYTEYIPKKAEFRYHVFDGEVIDIQQKRKKRGFENDRDTRVRNLHNGYVYCRDGINPPAGANELAISAVRALGYLYGAVDIIYNERRNQCYVLEVNSRPGLMGTTVDKYVNALIRKYDLRRV